MPIKLLTKEISELIAAGEVVERPASVVKELVENSLDAGALAIEVELEGNGLRSIRITDNGSGIARNEIPVAFMRHATSKIGIESDLDRIGTLGFRGEALAAIAAVSRVKVVTKTENENFASEYKIDGGQEISLGEAGGAVGTTIVVSDLFFNTPARMKFLKKDSSEGNAVQTVVEQIALSHPETAFRFFREGKMILNTPGNGDLFAAVYAVFPKEITGKMSEVSERGHPVSVTGYIGLPEVSRKSRGFQYAYVNGRYVKSPTVTSAVERGFRTFLMSGRFPVFVLNILLPYEDVDVNVHPAKTEVRFINDGEIFSAVYRAVSGVLERISRQGPFEHGEPVRGPESGPGGVPPAKIPEPDALPIIPEVKAETKASPSFAAYIGGEDEAREELYFQQKIAVPYVVSGENTGAPSVAVRSFDVPEKKRMDLDIDPVSPSGGVKKDRERLRVLGNLFDTYIVAECAETLIIIDKHAAHERILFETIRETDLNGSRQILLEPAVVAVTAEEKDALLNSRDRLGRVGFAVDDFGDGGVAVREVPTYFAGKRIDDAVSELAAQLLKHVSNPVTEETDWLLHSVACRAAIKAGHKTEEREMIFLAEKILFDEIPKYCPHGRPVFFTVTKRELEKRFGRLG